MRRRVRVPVQVKVSRSMTKHVCEVVQPRGGMESAREREAGRRVEISAAGVVGVLPCSDIGSEVAASMWGRK